LEDSDHNLWIATSEGLDLFDRKSQRFIKFKSDEKNSNAINIKEIKKLSKNFDPIDPNGYMCG
jgi:ligand-binding sensor domain-containing protein